MYLTSNMKLLINIIFCLVNVIECVTIRKLGGYEKLLARYAPNSKDLALSHGAAYIIRGQVSHEDLSDALKNIVKQHVPLITTISDDNTSWQLSKKTHNEIIQDALKTKSTDNFDEEWKIAFQKSLNRASFPNDGPLWRLDNILSNDKQSSAWIFTFNHGLDDQQSTNIIVNALLSTLVDSSSSSVSTTSVQQSQDKIEKIEFPPSPETAVAPENLNLNTLKWALYQTWNGIASPTVLPQHIQQSKKDDFEKYKTTYCNPDTRSTFVKTFIINTEITNKLRVLCKSKNISVTHVLSALIQIMSSALLQDLFIYSKSDTKVDKEIKSMKIRFLLSVSLRPFVSTTYIDNLMSVIDSQDSSSTSSSNSSSNSNILVSKSRIDQLKKDWAMNMIACAAGALDYNIDITTTLMSSLRDYLHRQQYSGNTDNSSIQLSSSLSSTEKDSFWTLAGECQRISNKLLKNDAYVPESVRLFNFGMLQVPGLDILKAVEIEARNPNTLGRGYTCGVSNAGVVNFHTSSPTSVSSTGSSSVDSSSSSSLSQLAVNEAYYGTSHGRNGVLSLLSCMTIKDQICGCLQFTSPITTDNEAELYVQTLQHYITCLVNTA